MSSIEPPWPLNERARLEKLKGYRVLDTLPEPVFDRLTQLGARHFGVPTALVSLVDEGRQWFKSRCGFDCPHTARRVSFCAYTILENKVMVVPDTTLDERFADNELVTHPPHIRFYAGAPLKTPDGLLLGTFCIIDQIPHHGFDAQALLDLEHFAEIVVHELEVRAARQMDAVARAQAEQARAEALRAEGRLRLILDTAVDAMVVIDEHSVIVSFNPAAQRMFGYEDHEAIGQNVRLLMPEPYRSAHTDYLGHYLRTGERRVIGIGREVEGRRKDGSVFPVELSVAEWSDDNGVHYFTGTMRDISARKEAERALRESHARFEGVLENITDPIFVKDPEGRYIAANSATARAFGRSLDEVIGHRDADLLPPEAAAHLVRVDQRIMRTGRAETVEEEFPDLSRGELRIFSTAKAVLRDADGGIIGITGVARDITDHKRAEEALRASEERFRALAEHTPQLMWLNRPDGVLEFFNAAWRSYTGHETIESTRWDILHPDDRKRVLELRAGAIATGEPYQYEMRLRRADGAYRWHLGRVSPMRQGGRIVAWIGTAVDVHDIRRAREVAEEADRSKGRFLAAASHDLRQPMQSILLFAEALRPHVISHAGGERLGRLLESLDTLKGLLDSLLDVSRLDADIIKPQIEEFPISDVVGPLAAAYAPVAEGKQLEWQVGPCSGIVRSDRVLLGRILRNLVENAIRYTRHGRILIRCTADGEVLRIAVEDTGIGIPEEHLERIWDEFHQVGNPERDRTQGLGLGLAIVRRLSKLLGHPVRASSCVGGGSVFSVDVPHAEIAIPFPEPSSEELGSVQKAASRLVVVVDDEAIVLLGLRTILEEWGHTVIIATCTEQAVERIQAVGRRPDLLLVDYRLREGKIGTEAVLRVRQMFGADVPGIIVTGEIGPEPQQDAATLGLGLLQKPVTPRLLDAALMHSLRTVT